jgi:hypothetical protein
MTRRVQRWAYPSAPSASRKNSSHATPGWGLIRAEERCYAPLGQASDLGGELVLHVDLECDAAFDDVAGVAGVDEGGLGDADDVFEQAHDDVRTASATIA